MKPRVGWDLAAKVWTAIGVGEGDVIGADQKRYYSGAIKAIPNIFAKNLRNYKFILIIKIAKQH